MTSIAGAHKTTSLTHAINDAVRFRTAAAIVLITAAAAANFVRLLLSPDQDTLEVPSGVPVVFLVLLAYEAAVLLWLRVVRDHSRSLPAWWVYANAIFECTIPTALVVAIATTSQYTLRAAYLGPATHLYAVFIVLSVLYVSSRVTIAASIVATLGLVGTVVVSAVTEDAALSPDGSLPRSLEGFSAFVVLLTGAAAALTAKQMRRYLATAVEEVELRSRAEGELRAAAVIQKSLLPREPPSVPGFEIIGWSRAASEAGGDYFDWVGLADGQTAVCIADVTGHGLGPAMVTGFCRAYARSSLRLESKLVTAMRRLNRELMSDLADGQFVTFAAVVISPESNRVLSLSAGHGPLLIYHHRTRSVTSRAADAFPLGLADFHRDLEPVVHELADGDVFMLVTDGFFEWSDPDGQQFGIDRLRTSLARYAARGTEDIISGMVKDVETHSRGTPQPDDLTAVVIRRVGDGRP